jgi:hypothetical protein
MLRRPTSAVADDAAQALTSFPAPSWPSILISIPIPIIFGLKLSDEHVYSPALAHKRHPRILLPRLRKSNAVETDMCCCIRGLHPLFIE